MNLYTAKILRRVGDMRGGHGQKLVILMVKMKEFFSWGDMSPMSSPSLRAWAMLRVRVGLLRQPMCIWK